MTKGIAQQLRDGSKNLDKMKREILETACIIRSQFDHYSYSLNPTAFCHLCKPAGRDHEMHYRWVIFREQPNIPRFTVAVDAIYISNYENDLLTMTEVFRNESTGTTKFPPKEHVQGVCDSLDEFVSALFAVEAFPGLKSDLQPLLDAGK
jgi:hypothetical protein